MDIALAAPPPGGLWRVTRRIYDPFSFPPPPPSTDLSEDDSLTGGAGRWDDPNGDFATLYTASSMSGSLIESLAHFRSTATGRRVLRTTSHRRVDPPAVSAAYLADRHIGVAQCHPDTRFIDVDDPVTHRSLDNAALLVLSWFGIATVDRSTMLSPDRRVTRYLAQYFWDTWADAHVRGIRYTSRIAPHAECFAVWDDPSPVDQASIAVHPIELDHPSLTHALDTLGLRLFE